jgi:hypothetical protein
MLVTPRFKPHGRLHPILAVIGELNGNGSDPTPKPFVDKDGKLHEGAYVSSHWGFDNMIEMPGEDDPNWEVKFDYSDPDFDEEYDKLVPREPDEWYPDDAPAHGDFSGIGVCDTPGQILNGPIGDRLRADQREFCISFVHIHKGEPPGRGGWRWHKWGPYIGTGKPEYEYLDDEKDFKDGVYTYHIYQVGGELQLADWKVRMRARDAERKAAEAKKAETE